jgi:putative oxidoreductase
MQYSQAPVQPYFPALAPLTAQLSDYAYPLMRFWVGATLAPHGCQKLFEWFGGSRAGVAAIFTKVGIEPALPLTYFVGTCELVCGLLVAFGLFTRAAAAVAFILLSVAWYKVHLVNGFFWTKFGIEYPLLWSVMMLGIAMRGGGRLSLDAKLGKEI